MNLLLLSQGGDYESWQQERFWEQNPYLYETFGKHGQGDPYGQGVGAGGVGDMMEGGTGGTEGGVPLGVGIPHSHHLHHHSHSHRGHHASHPHRHRDGDDDDEDEDDFDSESGSEGYSTDDPTRGDEACSY